MLLGIHLTLLIGPNVAAPAPPMLVEALRASRSRIAMKGAPGFR